MLAARVPQARRALTDRVPRPCVPADQPRLETLHAYHHGPALLLPCTRKKGWEAIWRWKKEGTGRCSRALQSE